MSISVNNGDSVDPVWDPFKDTMRTLYLAENRTLEDVRSEMANVYQFSATKAPTETDSLMLFEANAEFEKQSTI
jgi:Clr5 domain